MKVFYQAEEVTIKLEAYLTYFGLLMLLKEQLEANDDISQYDVFILSADTSGIYTLFVISFLSCVNSRKFQFVLSVFVV
jgi:hypothetical protein